jgi:hypothetical protein
VPSTDVTTTYVAPPEVETAAAAEAEAGEDDTEAEADGEEPVAVSEPEVGPDADAAPTAYVAPGTGPATEAPGPIGANSLFGGHDAPEGAGPPTTPVEVFDAEAVEAEERFLDAGGDEESDEAMRRFFEADFDDDTRFGR